MSGSPFSRACVELAGRNKHAAAFFLQDIARRIISGRLKTVPFTGTNRRAIKRTQKYLAQDFGWSTDLIKRTIRTLRDAGAIETDNGPNGGYFSQIALSEHAEAVLRDALKPKTKVKSAPGTGGKSAPPTPCKSAPPPGANPHPNPVQICTPVPEDIKKGIEKEDIQKGESLTHSGEEEDSGEEILESLSGEEQKVWRAFIAHWDEDTEGRIPELTVYRANLCRKILAEFGSDALSFVRYCRANWDYGHSAPMGFRKTLKEASESFKSTPQPDIGALLFDPNITRAYCAAIDCTAPAFHQCPLEATGSHHAAFEEGEVHFNDFGQAKATPYASKEVSNA